VVSALAVVEAGGAYLPLDPAFPPARLADMLAGAQARVAVATAESSGALEGFAGEIVDVGAQPRGPASARTARALPDNAAYVMYTSGSTGTPKAICVTHRNIVRLVRGADYVRFGPDEVMLEFAPVTFDAATFEIW